jgi:hypothetical protein
MKESVSFSNEDTEETSLNYSELRQKGIEYIQKLSGGIWTDYNLHDPGITILEQLCYALTDVSLRTSYNIKDLLTNKGNKQVDAAKNGLYAPSKIYGTHPVTINDLKKTMIDEIDEIQNVWIKTDDNSGFEERLIITEVIEILPKLTFNGRISFDIDQEKKLIKKVSKVLTKNRSLGEDVAEICLLKPKNISINFDIHLVTLENIENTMALLFMTLFEYFYSPIQVYSLEEMLQDGYTKSNMFFGPKLSKGFIKTECLKDQITEIDFQRIQQVLSKGANIYKCEVINILDEYQQSYEVLKTKKGEAFNLLEDKGSNGMIVEAFSRIYNHMKVFVNNNEFLINTLSKQKIHYLFHELWVKKYRQNTLVVNNNEEFNRNLKGTYRAPNDYHSIQHHFPLLYGIGKEGLPKDVPIGRHAKAKQFKAYLLFFEKYLADHLSQLSNIDEFFNIDFSNSQAKTYFSQKLSTVPNIGELYEDVEVEEDAFLFFERKNRVYDHMLARFGESLNELPWYVAYQVGIIKTENDFQRILLQKKSDYLLNVETLSANRIKGEVFLETSDQETMQRFPSGIENLMIAKTGISPRLSRNIKSHNGIVGNETFYVVDHILLRDFLSSEETQYGYKFVDELGNILQPSINENSWCRSKLEREHHLESLFKDNKEIEELARIFDKNQRYNSRSRLYELEKIRAEGTKEYQEGVYGQRRLIFQRKLGISEGGLASQEEVIIDEDFFNLSVSVVLPNWSIRFSDKRFSSYVEELIEEWMPSHMHTNILWMDKSQMKSFQIKYHNWENLMAQSEKNSKGLKKASYDVYKKMNELIRGSD